MINGKKLTCSEKKYSNIILNVFDDRHVEHDFR